MIPPRDVVDSSAFQAITSKSQQHLAESGTSTESQHGLAETGASTSESQHGLAETGASTSESQHSLAETGASTSKSQHSLAETGGSTSKSQHSLAETDDSLRIAQEVEQQVMYIYNPSLKSFDVVICFFFLANWLDYYAWTLVQTAVLYT